jgi:hypothetical protein
MKIVNYTPHDINVYGSSQTPLEDGPIFTYPKSGKVARPATIELGTMQGPDVWYELVEYGRLDGLPPRDEPGTLYIVSLVCALAARERDDLLAPYIEVRNDKGTIIGCRYLQKVC